MNKNSKILDENFFSRKTETVAKELLGKFLVRKIGDEEKRVIILETEGYDGLYDLASHAHIGKTERNKIMFGRPGIFYVYMCYGMHFMLNIVTREKDYPAAVLIRGVFVLDGNLNLNGPAKLTKFLEIGKDLNGRTAKKKSGLWFEDSGIIIGKNKIIKAPRVGVDYAGPLWSSKKLRFTIGDKNIFLFYK